MAVGLQRSGECAAPPADHRCAVGLLYSELQRRAASRRAMPCTSSFLFVDQSSSRRVEKFREDILTSPEDIRAQTLNFKANFKFSPLKMFGGTPVPVVVCAIKPWSISSVCKNLRGQHPLKAEM